MPSHPPLDDRLARTRAAEQRPESAAPGDAGRDRLAAAAADPRHPATPVPQAVRLSPNIVSATVADAERLAAIHAAGFPAAEAWSRDVFSLQLALPNVLGMLKADEGLILVRVAGGEAEVLTLAVVPAARRHGIATALLRRAVVLLKTAGASVVFLEVSVKNTAGLALYLQNGFSQAGLRRAYYSDGSDALVLRLDLPELA